MMPNHSQSTRRALLKSALPLAAAPALIGQARRQNVLFVLVDQWRAQATGYNGDPNARTPNIDRFAAESVNLSNAVSGAPVCCPYRGSLMTGQYQLTHGVYVNDVELKPKGATLGETFSKAGYRTGYIGKWHVYGSPDGQYGRRLKPVPKDKRFGFDYWKACECTHNYNKSLYYEGDDTAEKYWPGYDAIAQTDDACRFVEEKSKGSDPYFLVLSLGPPHSPYNTAPEKYKKLYEGREIDLRPNVPDALDEKAAEILRGYYAHIAALDDCFGKLLDTLRRTGTADDTVVVFTSDHGDMMLSQSLTDKQHPWDESIRVPFLVRHPRRFGPKPRAVAIPMDAPDIMPTLLGLCGIRVPDSVEGIDFASNIVSGETPKEDSGAFLNMIAPFTVLRRFGFAEYRGLRTERYTYVRSATGPWLLYDNSEDPFQKRNLINAAGYRSLRADMDKALDTRLKKRKDDFLPGAELIRRAGVSHYREVNNAVGKTTSPWGDWESTLAR